MRRFTSEREKERETQRLIGWRGEQRAETPETTTTNVCRLARNNNNNDKNFRTSAQTSDKSRVKKGRKVLGERRARDALGPKHLGRLRRAARQRGGGSGGTSSTDVADADLAALEE